MRGEEMLQDYISLHIFVVVFHLGETALLKDEEVEWVLWTPEERDEMDTFSVFWSVTLLSF